MTPRSNPTPPEPAGSLDLASSTPRPVRPLATASAFLLWSLTLVVMGVVLWRDPRPRPVLREDPAPPMAFESAARTVRVEPIIPVPHVLSLDEAEVRLGRQLFRDPRLAKGGAVSCASCHRAELGGADGRRRSVGASGRELDVHTPSAFNAVNDVWRASSSAVQSLEEHLDRHIADRRVLDTDWTSVADGLARDPELAARFLEIYPEGLVAATVRRALLTYERALVTPDAPFDQWLRGRDDALTPAEVEGYRLFKEVGCAACHQGVNVGGNMLQPVGRLGGGELDGLVDADGSAGHLRKVPSLRNVALTAPYFHDGSTDDLSEAVAIMARSQAGLELDADEVASIVSFLGSLTGQLPEIVR